MRFANELQSFFRIRLSIQNLNRIINYIIKRLLEGNPKLIYSDIGFEKNISGNNAGLVIGDRAFDLNKKYKYVYDLSLFLEKNDRTSFCFCCMDFKQRIA